MSAFLESLILAGWVRRFCADTGVLSVMGFYTKPRLLSWETLLFPCVAWLMGALLDEAGLLHHLSCASLVNMGMTACCWQVRVMVQPPTSGRGLLCNCCCSRGFALQLVGAEYLHCQRAAQCFGSNSGEIRNAAEEAPRRWATGGRCQ